MNKPMETAFPPPERGQHDAIEHVKDALTGHEVYRIAEPTQIERYYAQGKLGANDEAVQLRDAGLEYMRCAYVGCLGPRYTKINMHRVLGVPTDGLEQQEAAEKIRLADAALGQTHASFVWAVCVEQWTANGWARERARQRGWGPPNREFGIELLRDALRQLVAHWASE